MVAKQGISAYQNVQLETADPGKLIVLLYQKLDDELRKAKELLLKGDMFGKGNAIIRSQDILMELNNSLNMDAGEIAHNLRSLYLFLFRQLNEINLNKDVQTLEKVIQIVANLKSAWEEIVQNPPKMYPRMAQKRPVESAISIQG